MVEENEGLKRLVAHHFIHVTSSGSQPAEMSNAISATVAAQVSLLENQAVADNSFNSPSARDNIIRTESCGMNVMRTSFKVKNRRESTHAVRLFPSLKG